MSFGDESRAFLKSYLDNVRLRGHHDVFVVGSFDEKKTIATQQQRASVLALAAAQELDQNGEKIAVIGGGFAGVSCAATLLKLGFNVSLFEQKDRLVPIQIRCRDRYIHPTLYDWPNDASDDTFRMAGVVWHPGYADEVAQQAIDSFDAVVRGHQERFDPHFGIRVEKIEVAGDGKVQLISEKRHKFGDYSATFVTIGFGFEKPVSIGNRIRRYWENSSLGHIHGRKYAPARVLVSGSGDGGLISVLDSTFREFDHSTLHKEVEGVFGGDVVSRIRDAEKFIGESWRRRASVNVIDTYDQAIGPDVERVSKGLASLISDETAVTFNSDLPGVFTPTSSALNRSTVYFLMRGDLISFKGDRLDVGMVSEDASGEGLEHVVEWRSGLSRYDHIIVRHGVRGNHFERTFAELVEFLPGRDNATRKLSLEDAIPNDIKYYLRDL